MTTVVATVFEVGHYEAGVAALLNSLIEAGYRGHMWCGVRGATPAWLEPQCVAECTGGAFAVTTVELATERHLALYKPHFMMQVAREEDASTNVAYLDPDVVVKCDWAFVDRWCSRGIAAVADDAPQMPASSPERRDWLDFRRQVSPAFDPSRAGPLDVYCNSGFIGVSRRCEAFLELWRCLLDETVARGAAQAKALHGPRPGEWFVDQEVFNMALMEWASEACVMGPEAMDFSKCGGVFNHAIGTPKPWQHHAVTDTLLGRRAATSDWIHFRYRQGPFLPISAARLRYIRLRYVAACGIGRIAKLANPRAWIYK